ncbi:hypothetical protein [Flagellimonas flava]|uniref:hypothetical protein n=1 Tax=Flagellimonas flava TaxID=570519 RepID=UPI003D6494C8
MAAGFFMTALAFQICVSGIGCQGGFFQAGLAADFSNFKIHGCKRAIGQFKTGMRQIRALKMASLPYF